MAEDQEEEQGLTEDEKANLDNSAAAVTELIDVMSKRGS